MNTKLSIIIPFYGNADKTLLDRCIKSIETQKMERGEYEIIIADDAGKGLGGARNNGMLQAKGKYLLFIDADDYYFPDTLKQCFSLLSQNPDIVSFGYQVVSKPDELPKKKKVEIKTYTSGAEYMSKHNFTGTAWRHFFSRECLMQHQLVFPENVYHEDEAFIAKTYFHARKTIITTLPVYGYYQHSYSIIHKQDSASCIRRIQDFRLILTSLKEYMHNEASPLQQYALQRRIHFLTIDYIIQLIHNRINFLVVHKKCKALIQTGFLPLPNMKYSWKYSVTRVILNLFARI